MNSPTGSPLRVHWGVTPSDKPLVHMRLNEKRTDIFLGTKHFNNISLDKMQLSSPPSS